MFSDVGGIIAIVIILIIVIALIVTNIRIVPPGERLCERLGAYHATWQVGLHIKIPLIDKVAKESIS